MSLRGSCREEGDSGEGNKSMMMVEEGKEMDWSGILEMEQSPTQTTQRFGLATWPQGFEIWMGHP